MTPPRKPPAKPSLSDEDKALWQQVTQTVRPLNGRPKGQAIKPRTMVERKRDAVALPSEWHAAYYAPAPSTIDRRTRRKIASGTREVDRSIDLHGMTQNEAYALLVRTVHGAVKRGDKLLLVVTGKGGRRHSQLAPETPVAYRTRSDFEQAGGVLRRMVPLWLAETDLKPFIESYGPAAKEHGGDGALYIMLRRRVPGSRKGGAS